MKKPDIEASKDLHRQALKYAEDGNLDEAEVCLKRAIAEDSANPVLRILLANILKEKKQFAQAEQLLSSIIEENPELAATYNNLGTLLFVQGKFTEAVSAYQAAIDRQPDYADAYFNLGLALNKAKRRSEALNAFMALTELTPEHVGGRFQLGCLWMQQEKYKSAHEQFAWIVKAHPFHVETLANIAACCLKMGLLDDALSFYLRALALTPEDIQVLFNLGVIHMQLGKIQEAIRYYLSAVTINPDFYEGHNNLSVAYLAIKDYEAAKLHYREVLRVLPNNEAVRHTIDILSRSESVTGSPPEYIRALFDGYADHYDSHLAESLDYQVPRLLHDVVQAAAGIKNKRLDILDLGCGTGLTGCLFKSVARSLTGVDLSENMVAVAAGKKIYDELVVADITSFLTGKKNAYDLIVAGDVVNYFGDLEAMFALVKQALRPSGFFAFNTEVSTTRSYQMTETGRFAHSEAYINELAKNNQLKVEQHLVEQIRVQEGKAVKGHIYVLSC